MEKKERKLKLAEPEVDTPSKESKNSISIEHCLLVADMVYENFNKNKEAMKVQPNDMETVLGMFLSAHRIMATKTKGGIIDTINSLNSAAHNIDCYMLANKLRDEFNKKE